MESSYQAALRRRQKLIEELEKVEQYIILSHELFGEPAPEWIQRKEPSHAKMSIGEAARLMALDSGNRASAHAPRAESEPRIAAKQLPPGYARPSQVIFAAKQILLEVGRPMTRSQLLAAMEERGMVIPGADRSKTLGTTLWRARNTFVQLEGHGYWLRDRANTLVGYDPRGLVDEREIDGGEL